MDIERYKVLVDYYWSMDECPTWARYVALDSGGEICAYSTKPRLVSSSIVNDTMQWHNDEDSEDDVGTKYFSGEWDIITKLDTPFDIDVRKTLIKL